MYAAIRQAPAPDNFQRLHYVGMGPPDLSELRQRDLCARCLKTRSALRKGKDYETGKVAGRNGRVLV